MYASNTAEILAAIQTLFPEGSLIELRIPRKSGTIVGYFKDQQALADAITKYSGKVPAVYYTLNVPTPDFYTVYPDRVVPQKATADCQIVRRQWLLIDCDPVRFGADGPDEAGGLGRARTAGRPEVQPAQGRRPGAAVRLGPHDERLG